MHPIEPLPSPPEFYEMWHAAGVHLNARIKDGGGRWLRAELPGFRDHLSFTFGNQLFFVQVLDINGGVQPWINLSLLDDLAQEAKGIACLMPMKKIEGSWQSAEGGWGLVGLADDLPLQPERHTPDEPIVISEWEVHDLGVQFVRNHLIDNGFKIQSWQSDIRIDPAISCLKDDTSYGIVVRTSRKGPDAALRPENAEKIASTLSSNSVVPLFVGLKVAGENDFFDPRLAHLTRRICRGEKILCSSVVLQPLVRN